MQTKIGQQIAIMFFTRSADEEARVKHFIAGNQDASRQIADCLITHTLQIIRKTQLPYYVIGTELQKGETFGEKYANAFTEIFNKGFSKIISIGNDCASLTHYDLLKAAKQLQNNEVVFGADRKGGLYLVAITKNVFDSKTFSELPWETEYLSQSFSLLLKSNKVRICQIEVKRDLDTTNDILTILHSQNIHFRLKQFAAILFYKSQIANFTTVLYFISALTPCFSSLKSPPAF